MRANWRNTGCNLALSCTPARRCEPGFFRTGGPIISTPVIGEGDVIYVGAADGRFYAVDPHEHHEGPAPPDPWRWVRPPMHASDGIDSAACVDPNGVVYYGTFSGHVCGARTSDGGLVWDFPNVTSSGKRRYTPSPIYWFEANVVQGPDGCVYAGCDDFCMYGMPSFDAASAGEFVQHAEPRLIVPTGLHIWSAPAFDAERETMYFASFDLHLYAVSYRTGKLRWRVCLGNFVASSAAIGPDGTVFVATFGGSLFAINDRGKRASVREIYRAGAPIYASPAIAETPDGEALLYVGSLDGVLHVFSVRPGKAHPLSSAFVGHPLIGSVAVGPDPDRTDSHRAYVGGSDGTIHAFSPRLDRHWRFDTRRHLTALGVRHNAQFAAINASIALGDHGLAAADADGFVIYAPYDWVTDDAARAPVRRRGGRMDCENRLSAGAGLFVLSPGGRLGATRVDAVGEVPVSPFGVLALQAISRDERGRPRFVELHRTVRVEPDAGEAPHVLYAGDGATILLVPRACLPTGDPITYVVSGTTARRPPTAVRGVARLCARPVGDAAPPDAIVGRPFRIRRMALPWPPIIPSFDMIGICEIEIDVAVLWLGGPDSCGERRGVAWGVEYFGTGVFEKRRILYAFEVTLRDGYILLEACDTRFETTAFDIPVDRFRLDGACVRAGQGFEIRRSTVVATLDRTGLWRAGLGVVTRAVRAALWPPGRTRSGVSRRRLPPLAGVIVYLKRAWALLWRYLVVMRMLDRAWNVYDMRRVPYKAHAFGSFEAVSDPNASVNEVPLTGRGDVSIRKPLRRRGNRIKATIDDPRITSAYETMRHMVGILLCEKVKVDGGEQLRPMMMDYTRRTRVRRSFRGGLRVHLTCRLNAKKRYRAYLMVGLEVVAETDV